MRIFYRTIRAIENCRKVVDPDAAIPLSMVTMVPITVNMGGMAYTVFVSISNIASMLTVVISWFTARGTALSNSKPV